MESENQIWKSLLSQFLKTALQRFKRTKSGKKVSRHSKETDYTFSVKSDTVMGILYILIAILLQLLVIYFATSDTW